MSMKPSKKKRPRAKKRVSDPVFEWVWRCRRSGMETPRRSSPVKAALDIPDNPCSSCRLVPVVRTELPAKPPSKPLPPKSRKKGTP